MRKTKILYFQLEPTIGGIETFLINLYNKIDKNKFQLDFVANTSNINSLPYLDKLKGANIFPISNFKNITQYVKNINNILNRKYDIVHFNKNSNANIIPLFLAKHNKNVGKIIVHSHNTNPSSGKKILQLLHYINKPYVDKIANYKIACSSAAAKWLFTSNDIEIIKNGIDVRKYLFSTDKRCRIREKYGIPLDSKVIGFVGRFTHQKNLPFLIDIFNKYQELNPNSYLLLVGDGVEKKAVSQKVARLNINKKVLFTGEKMNIIDYLDAMDIFVMSSFYEGLPISCIEAQASGLNTFISDTISDEVKLLSNLKQFDLHEGPEKIAQSIFNTKISSEEKRYLQNSIVYNKYDITKTVSSINDLYNRITEEKNND